MSAAELSRRANLRPSSRNRYIQALTEIGAVARRPGGRLHGLNASAQISLTIYPLDFPVVVDFEIKQAARRLALGAKAFV
jgi:hypothetical protein